MWKVSHRFHGESLLHSEADAERKARVWASGSLAARRGAPGSANPSQLVRSGRIPPVIRTPSRQRNRTGPRKQKLLPQFRGISAAAHSIAAFGVPARKSRSRSCLPPPPLPNGSPLRLRGRAAPRRVFERLWCANKQRAGGEKQQPWRLAKWSSTLSPRSICAAAPRPPLTPPHSPPSLHISRGPLIGWPHVAAST